MALKHNFTKNNKKITGTAIAAELGISTSLLYGNLKKIKSDKFEDIKHYFDSKRLEPNEARANCQYKYFVTDDNGKKLNTNEASKETGMTAIQVRMAIITHGCKTLSDVSEYAKKLNSNECMRDIKKHNTEKGKLTTVQMLAVHPDRKHMSVRNINKRIGLYGSESPAIWFDAKGFADRCVEQGVDRISSHIPIREEHGGHGTSKYKEFRNRTKMCFRCHVSCEKYGHCTDYRLYHRQVPPGTTEDGACFVYPKSKRLAGADRSHRVGSSSLRGD